MNGNVSTRLAVPEDLPAIRALHARVFGPGRFARSAYRAREGTADLSRFCRVAVSGPDLVAALRMTEAAVGAAPGVLLLGPLAVAIEFAGQGYGRQLVREALDHAKADGVRLVVLVGDESYYGRLGFRPVPAGQIVFAGPADPARVLAAELAPGALSSYRGMVSSARALPRP